MRLFEGTQFDVPPRCERCDELESDCKCGPLPVQRKPPAEQTATIVTEKRKRGKVVTVIRGLSEPDCDLAGLVTTLKDHCGSGGTVKNEEIVIQGDQVHRIREKLQALGFALTK